MIKSVPLRTFVAMATIAAVIGMLLAAALVPRTTVDVTNHAPTLLCDTSLMPANHSEVFSCSGTTWNIPAGYMLSNVNDPFNFSENYTLVGAFVASQGMQVNVTNWESYTLGITTPTWSVSNVTSETFSVPITTGYWFLSFVPVNLDVNSTVIITQTIVAVPA